MPTFTANPECNGTFNPPILDSGTELKIDGVLATGYTINYYTHADDGGNGLIQPGYDNFYDGDNKTWKDAEGYLTQIKTRSESTKDDTAMNLVPEQTGPYTFDHTKVNDQYDKDLKFITQAKGEYCYYIVRYTFFLNNFLEAVRLKSDPDASVYLKFLIDLNRRLNAFVSLIDHIANKRAEFIDLRTETFNKWNDLLQKNTIDPINNAKDIDSKKSILNTRKEMIRYTKEKNNSISNNISLWAALNVVAIAMIFTLYRKM